MIWTFLRQLFRSPERQATLFGRTDTGRTRPNNEDSFFIQPRARLMMVADGMGGHNAGEVASRVAIETMASLLDPAHLARAGANQVEVCHHLIHALRLSNERVMAMADENETYAGMGCTLIAGFITHNRLYTCHVGDVRAYLLHQDGIRQITSDHTLVAEYTKAHKDDADFDPSALHMNRNIVSRAIGFPFPEDPECTVTPMAPGDRILLCSDGLWSMVPDTELALSLKESATPEEACDRLILAANEAGGKDNITAVVAFA